MTSEVPGDGFDEELAQLQLLAAWRRWLRETVESGEARRVRVAAGLSQDEVAAVCRVSREAISRWENGDRAPSGAAAVRYARLLRRIGEMA